MGILKISVVILAVCCGTALQQANAQTDEEITSVLEKIFSPESEASIHARVLRRDIVQRLYDALQREQLEDDLLGYKRSDSMAQWRFTSKRNLAALAKGGYIRTIPDNDDQEQEEEQDKRSLASIVRNGQLPKSSNSAGEEKRGIEALARNGELHHHQTVQDLIDDLYEKRNLASLARGRATPSAYAAFGKRYLGALMKNARYVDAMEGKRNVASLARTGGASGNRYGKRNVAALLRQDKIHGPNDRSYEMDDQMQIAMSKQSDGRDDDNTQKRNVGAAKANGYKPPFKRSVNNLARNKRNIDYYSNDEYAVPVYQNQNVRDYEELMKALTGEYPTEKRFLGSVAKSGWFRPQASDRSFVSRIDKRHIGSLARLGWLPSFRQIRRFSRSSRSIPEANYRSSPANGQVEDYTFAESQLRVTPKRHRGSRTNDSFDITADISIDTDNPIPQPEKRFFVQPVVDKALLVDKVLMQRQIANKAKLLHD